MEKEKKRIGMILDSDKHFDLKMLALKKKMTLTDLIMNVLNELLEREKAGGLLIIEKTCTDNPGKKR